MAAPRAYPKKRFGQHFITDKNLLAKIVRTARVKERERVIEIGPGKGSLTGALLDAGALVTAIEIDRDLVKDLKERFLPTGRFELIEADSLFVPFTSLMERYGTRLKCVSNLPYNISGPILFKFIEERRAFTLLVLMFQKEVAERITAPPGGKDYGVISVLSQAFFRARKEFNVSRNLFSPRPEVDSAVISLETLDAPATDIGEEGFFIRVVKASFAHRRKTILNSLKSLAPSAPKAPSEPSVLDKGVIEEALKEAGIDPGRRAESLTLPDFGRLALSLRRRLPQR